MRTEIAAILGLAAVATQARDINSRSLMTKREVPQEQSHKKFLDGVKTALDLNNQFQIVDPVFALLGNKAAADGAGLVTNLDCLQQIVADEAFTNAKAANDIVGQTNALIFRALERNTGSVGLTSVLCNETANNAEIAALTQHQDPASNNADTVNKAIELELAKQLAAIGADPLLALQSGTFPPGQIGDPTGAGLTCDVETDAEGCIFTQNLLTPIATEADIQAAVAGVASNNGAAGNKAAAGNKGAASNATAGAKASTANVAASAAAGASSANIQTFTGALGGAAPAVIQSNSDRPFSVNGATFVNAGAALTRSCDIQNNACFNAVNSGQLAGGTAQCSQQQDDCIAATSAAARKLLRRQNNIQSFNGKLGGAAPAVIQSGGDRPFSVNGATFVNAGAALARSCDIQNNACFNAANAGQLAGGTAQCSQQQAACTAAAGAAARKMRRGLYARQALDFGDCADPSVQFAANLDGRKESSFAPVNSADFNHGSALNIKVISDFICSQLGSSCQAGADAVTACDNASKAAQAAQAAGQAGAQVASTFNSALGV